MATLPGSVPEQSVTFTATAEPGAPSQWGFALDTFKQLTTIPFDAALVLQDAYANPTTADGPVTVTVTATNQSFAESITGASDGTLAVDGVTGPVAATLPAGQTEVTLTDLVYDGLSAPAAELPDIELLASATLGGEAVTGTTLISARNIQLVVLATPDEIVADGQETSLITTALLDLAGDPIANQPVRFENTLGQLLDAAGDEVLVGRAQNGVLAGYPLLGLKATLYDGSFHDVDSNEMAFKIAASMATKQLARHGGAALLEPMMKVEVVTPEENMGDVVGDLNRRRGLILGMDENVSGKVINAEVPLAEMFGYATDLRSATQGRATYTMEFAKYAEAPSNVADQIISKNQTA